MKKLALLSGTGLAILLFAFTTLVPAFVSPYVPRLQTVFTGLSSPILIRNARDGSKRLFIVEQGGMIKVVQPGSVTPTTFINLSSKVIFIGGGDERGLLGLAFHPQFATNGKFYVNYTRLSDGATIVAEYKVSAGNPNQGDISSERILFTVPQPFVNHNGGMVEFGPDGYLYIGMGDGGSGNDPGNRAQNPAQLLGKMLRIDVNMPDGTTNPAYLIPPTNPFTGAGTVRCDNGSTTNGNTCQEIWTIGMRNPWRWSFDRGGTNQLYIGDVGQGAVEEIDIGVGGANYGWRVYEGNNCTNNDPSLCVNPNPYTPPIFQYTHQAGRCAITGGYVYRGTQGSLPSGAYVFADYCSGEIWTLQNGTQTLLQDTPRLIPSFGEDEDGELYVCYTNGQIDKITRAKASADFDGDARTDLSVFRPTEGNWYVSNSSNGGVQFLNWGTVGDVPVPKDYDGDNITDLAVFRASSGQWYIVKSSDGTVDVVDWGTVNDVPVAGDYDGDAKADLAVWRPSTGEWFVRRSSDSGVTYAIWGTNGDRPAPGDFDGDGKFDLSVWRPSTGDWYSINSSNGAVRFVNWGIASDINVSGDFDADGRTDTAVYRPSTGTWYIARSLGGVIAVRWGAAEDRPQVGDYDGDGKDDIGVFRPSTGEWYVSRSSNGSVLFAHWGTGTDLAVPGLDTP